MRETEKARVTVVFCLLISTTKKVELTFTEMGENVKGEDVGGIHVYRCMYVWGGSMYIDT